MFYIRSNPVQKKKILHITRGNSTRVVKRSATVVSIEGIVPKTKKTSPHPIPFTSNYVFNGVPIASKDLSNIVPPYIPGQIAAKLPSSPSTTYAPTPISRLGYSPLVVAGGFQEHFGWWCTLSSTWKVLESKRRRPASTPKSPSTRTEPRSQPSAPEAPAPAVDVSALSAAVFQTSALPDLASAMWHLMPMPADATGGMPATLRVPRLEILPPCEIELMLGSMDEFYNTVTTFIRSFIVASSEDT